MNSKVWIIVGCFLIWSVGSGWFYTCKIKQVCPSSQALQHDSLPICFSFNSSEPTVSSRLPLFLDSINEKATADNILELVGLYVPEELEVNPNDLGLIRANKFLKLYRDSLAATHIRVTSEQVELDSSKKYFSGLRFAWYTKNNKLEEGENGAILYLNEKDTKSLDPKVNAYLTYLAIERKDDVIDLVGHCYDEDSSGANYTGGLVLANFVRNKLVSKGFNEYQVNASSSGDLNPLNQQDSVARVEVLINN